MKDERNIERAKLIVMQLNAQFEWGTSTKIEPATLRDVLRDLLDEIAALREARDALAGDETPEPDPLIEARNAETARMDAGVTRALAELPPTRNPFADAPQRDAATPRVRLTERMVRTLKRAAMAGDGMVYGGRCGEVNGRSAQALVKRGLMEPAYSYDCGMFRITPQGRAALRDAEEA